MLFTFNSLVLSAQCKYEFNKKDAITNESIFLTKPILLSTRTKVKGDYTLKKAKVQIEKTSQGGNIQFDIRFKKKDVFAAMFSLQTDSLILKFDDEDVINLKLTKLPTVFMGATGQRWILSYDISEEVLVKFKSGAQVQVIRIMSTGFNLDILEFENSLTDKFQQCWFN